MKTFFTLVLLSISFLCHSQLFVGIGVSTKGGSITAGMAENNTAIAIAHDYPFFKAAIATVTSFSVTQSFDLTSYETDNFKLTAGIGIASTRYKEFIAENVIQHKAILPLYTIEFSKDWYLGRLYVDAKYCGGIYYGIGMKGFFR